VILAGILLKMGTYGFIRSAAHRAQGDPGAHAWFMGLALIG